MPADWSLLADELRNWTTEGVKPQLWLRDDDAVAPSSALDRLLALCGRYETPAVLAVIPDPTGDELANRLKDVDLIHVAAHGWRHANHASRGEKKQELGKHRPMPEILAELARGYAKLSALHGDRFLPMLVPPWNRIDEGLLAHLHTIGFSSVSSFADNLPQGTHDDLVIVNTHVDIMDWSSRRGRDHAALVASFVSELKKSRKGEPYPVGILTHHAVHDEGAWNFLDQLFEMTALNGACEWLPGDSLLKPADRPSTA